MEYKRRQMRRFDEQAETFDRRAGLTEKVCQEIAHAIGALAHPNPTDVILDIGAGTGGIGSYLSNTACCYVGMDLSKPMLDVFRQQAMGTNSGLRLIQADGNDHWPVTDHSVQIVFSSRALHLLSIPHVVNELFRVAANKGAMLIIGRIDREKDSVRSRMRRKMRQLLKQYGRPEISGEHNREEMIAACFTRGAQKFRPRIAACWNVSHSPVDSLKSWKMKTGLAGIEVPPQVKSDVLARLETWAYEVFGGLNKIAVSEERYILEGVCLT